MKLEYSSEDGRLLVEIAHKAINEYITNGETLDLDKEFPKLPSRFKEKRGMFVTLYINKDLRGCIGLPVPIQSLAAGVRDMAISAATEDYRFQPISESELGELQIEISVLSVPEELKPDKKEDIVKKVKVGRDGLIVESDWQRGLLLPQVAVEEGWNSEQFLDHTCIKAGLHEGCWKEANTRIYTFHAVIFTEQKDGSVKMTLPE